MGSYRRSKRKGKDSSSFSIEFSPLEVRDKNARFVVKKCCDYLLRLMSRRISITYETIEFICWIVGDRMFELGEFVLSKFSGEARQEYLEELLSEQGNISAYGGELFRILNKTENRWMASKFIDLAKSLVRQTKNSLKASTGSNLEKSIAYLQKIFNLTDLEAELCFFFFIADTYSGPDDFFDDHLKAVSFQGMGHLATMMGVSRSDINTAINKTLAPAELIEKGNGCFSSSKFELSNETKSFLEKGDSDILEEKNLKRINGRLFLPLEDHFIPGNDIAHVLALLARKTDSATHILLYGPPGTGKTSFARGLARHLADPVYEIVQNNSEENESKMRRLVLNACVSSMNRDNGSVFIVDEADNMLNTENAWFRRGETQDKGWLNSLMERPGLRIVWIVNHIHAIEDSVLRRFAFSLQFKPFNRQQREALWAGIVRRHRCKRFFTDDDLRYLAQTFQTNAGVIDLAVKKAKEAGHMNRKAMLQAVWQGVEAHQVLTNGGHKKSGQDALEECYSLEGLNMSADIDAVLDQTEQFDRYLRDNLDQARFGFTLLLHGPPGTGKSEFARFLARHLDRELLVRRLSDLLDPYVGMTERYIREAFDQAAGDGSILLIDEADALLFPRDGAVRSWEVSRTSELLTAMERFAGFLVATTNRLTGLDTAAIRRFNHKIEFDFLTPEGNRLFYERMLAPMVAAMADEETVRALNRLCCLTPGDFKTVRDRFAFYPKGRVTAAMLVEALQQEAKIKEKQGGKVKIGF